MTSEPPTAASLRSPTGLSRPILALSSAIRRGAPRKPRSICCRRSSSTAFGTGITLRNRTSYGDYDKFYQNVFPGAVNAAGTTCGHHGIQQFDGAPESVQSDGSDRLRAGPAGSGTRFFWARSLAARRRIIFATTGYFTAVGPNVTSVQVPLDAPTTSSPLEFRQAATDADNHGVAADGSRFTPRIRLPSPSTSRRLSVCGSRASTWISPTIAR